MSEVTITVDSPGAIEFTVEAPSQPVIDVTPAATIEIDVTSSGPPGQGGPPGPPGTTDHGLQQGIADDDHTQYALVQILPQRPTNPRPGTIWVIDT
jgi:hypothetical protein